MFQGNVYVLLVKSIYLRQAGLFVQDRLKSCHQPFAIMDSKSYHDREHLDKSCSLFIKGGPSKDGKIAKFLGINPKPPQFFFLFIP